MIIKNILKVSLYAVIPILIFGFNILEKTEIYSSILNISGAESAYINKLTTNYGDPKRLIITDQDEEFEHLWQLIKDNSKYPIQKLKPKIISRLAIEHGSCVTLQNDQQVVLIPDQVPIIAMMKSEEEFTLGLAKEKDAYIVGTVGDIRDWIVTKKENVRFWRDIIVAIISIILGSIVNFGWKDKNQIHKKKEYKNFQSLLKINRHFFFSGKQ
ncbi:MAG: hypothetical protein PHU88_06400 [candidate division Zixibacteria bacterium]|nr:hypothetical protein [candidate division Zixibacteria bacterium]MDD5426848.1 hypothetical protein [candidate division Zixibacteria bacterium]